MLFLKLGIIARFQSPCLDNTLSLESDCSCLAEKQDEMWNEYGSGRNQTIVNISRTQTLRFVTVELGVKDCEQGASLAADRALWAALWNQFAHLV